MVQKTFVSNVNNVKVQICPHSALRCINFLNLLQTLRNDFLPRISGKHSWLESRNIQRSCRFSTTCINMIISQISLWVFASDRRCDTHNNDVVMLLCALPRRRQSKYTWRRKNYGWWDCNLSASLHSLKTINQMWSCESS